MIPVRWVHSLEVVRTAIDDPLVGSQAITDTELDDPEDDESEIPMTADENFVCRAFASGCELQRSIAFGIAVAVCLFYTIIGVCRTTTSTHRAQCSFELNTDPFLAQVEPSSGSCQIDRRLLLTAAIRLHRVLELIRKTFPGLGPDIQLLNTFNIVSKTYDPEYFCG